MHNFFLAQWHQQFRFSTPVHQHISIFFSLLVTPWLNIVCIAITHGMIQTLHSHHPLGGGTQQSALLQRCVALQNGFVFACTLYMLHWLTFHGLLFDDCVWWYFLMACMWGRFIVGTAHFSTESNLIWSNSIAIKSISPTLGWRKDNMRRFKSLDWKINTSLKNSQIF